MLNLVNDFIGSYKRKNETTQCNQLTVYLIQVQLESRDALQLQYCLTDSKDMITECVLCLLVTFTDSMRMLMKLNIMRLLNCRCSYQDNLFIYPLEILNHFTPVWTSKIL